VISFQEVSLYLWLNQLCVAAKYSLFGHPWNSAEFLQTGLDPPCR